MTEAWREVPGYEGWYDASDLGRVRRVRGGDRNTLAGRVLKPQGAPYLHVTLFREGVFTRPRLHVLICTLFNGPKPTPRHEVNHIDGVKSNCSAKNLEWATHGQNVQHQYATGLMPDRRGANNPNSVARKGRYGDRVR